VVERLGWLGATLNAAANGAGDRLISGPDSRFPVYVLPTDEELMIARHTLQLL
jgi:acetate kinase